MSSHLSSDRPPERSGPDVDHARQQLITAAKNYLASLNSAAGIAQVDARCFVLVGDLESIRGLVDAVDPASSNPGNDGSSSSPRVSRYALSPLERR